MKIIKTIVALAFMSLTTTISAQEDDWQIGGGGGRAETYRGNVYKQSSYGRNLFNGGHKDAPYGFVIGYVNKTWNTDFGSYLWKENIWGEKDKRLHGLQIGFHYNPCLNFGLGFKTGLFYEAYFSESSPVKENGWDNFTENNFYIPAHLTYRFPFSRNCSLSLFGGIAFQWAFSSEYTRYYGYDYWGDRMYIEHMYQRYDSQWPKRVNWQAEIGANLRLNDFLIGFTYSRGLTDHQFYKEAKTRQNKIAISLGYVLDGEL